MTSPCADQEVKAPSPGASLTPLPPFPSRSLPPGAFAGFPARFLRHQGAPRASVRPAGMALFHVARYRGTERAGPEAAAAEEGAESRARTLLERLQSRARERQQQREQEEQQQQQQESEQAGRRRRRPRRSRGRASSQASPQEPASKRRKEDGGAADADAGADGPGTDAAEGVAGPPDEPPGIPAPAPLIGGFRRIKTPKVSGLGRNEPCMMREPTLAAHTAPAPGMLRRPLILPGRAGPGTALALPCPGLQLSASWCRCSPFCQPG